VPSVLKFGRRTADTPDERLVCESFLLVSSWH
jgi:hypothetical protein